MRCQVWSLPLYWRMSRTLGSRVDQRAEAVAPRISMYQVLRSPGEMRKVFNVQGKAWPDGSAAVERSVALSHVSQGAVPPFPSGRSAKILARIARVFCGIQPAR